MLLIAMPKSASSSLSKTIAKSLEIEWKNGDSRRNTYYCNGFKEIQKYHTTMVPRKKEYIEKYCTDKRVIYKEHILPTKEHIEIIKNLDISVVVLLRNPGHVLDSYKRFAKNNNLKMNYETIKNDIIKFYNEYVKLKEEKLDHILFINYKDLILNYEETMKKIFIHYKTKPKNIFKLEKEKYTGIGELRLKKGTGNRIEKIKRFWDNRADDNLRHIKLDQRLISEDHMNKLYKRYVIRKNEFQDKVVLDYGIGGGWLGKLLFKYQVDKYIGYDVSQKSLDFARKNLKNTNSKLILVKDENYHFDLWYADYFICLACTQHFINQTYLNNFLKQLNESGINKLILQIRYSSQTQFFGHNYKTKDEVVYACYTNELYLKGKLDNYKIKYDSGVVSDVGLKYLQFERKK